MIVYCWVLLILIVLLVCMVVDRVLCLIVLVCMFSVCILFGGSIIVFGVVGGVLLV